MTSVRSREIMLRAVQRVDRGQAVVAPALQYFTKSFNTEAKTYEEMAAAHRKMAKAAK